MPKTNWSKYDKMNARELKRFNKFIKEEGEHRLWTGACIKAGYGVFKFRKHMVLTHTLALVHKEGKPDDLKMECAHSCRFKNCISCISWKTHSQNQGEDRLRDGTDQYGEKNSQSKLTNEKVLSIRAEYSTDNFTQKELGLKYGASQQEISNIVNRKTWTHI